MCLDKILAMLKPKPPVILPEPFRPEIPYPEETPDYTRTLDNTRIDEVLNEWLLNYKVPCEYWSFWKTKIVIGVTEAIPYPAQQWEQDGVRHLQVRPEWVNPGVIAHEQAHNSFALLSGVDKQFFSIAYNPLKDTDPLIKLLYSINSYGLTSEIEGHAEIYRYLGGQMPDILKQYYPRLF